MDTKSRNIINVPFDKQAQLSVSYFTEILCVRMNCWELYDLVLDPCTKGLHKARPMENVTEGTRVFK